MTAAPPSAAQIGAAPLSGKENTPPAETACAVSAGGAV